MLGKLISTRHVYSYLIPSNTRCRWLLTTSNHFQCNGFQCMSLPHNHTTPKDRVGSWNDDETTQYMPSGFDEVALDPESHADQILDARYNTSEWIFETYTWYEFNVTAAVSTAACNAHLSANGGTGNVSFALLSTSNTRTSVRQRDYRCVGGWSVPCTIRNTVRNFPCSPRTHRLTPLNMFDPATVMPPRPSSWSSSWWPPRYTARLRPSPP